jgi:hypothetical protein
MAKKIIISFASNLMVGQILGYNIKVNNQNIAYNLLGNNVFNVGFSNNNSTASNVKIRSTADETLNELFLVLNTYWDANGVTYSLVGNTIEVKVFSENATVESVINPVSIIVFIIDVVINSEPTLFYFMEYSDPLNVPYRVNIYKKNNNIAPRLIYGYATLEAGSVKDNLDPIRGSGLTLNLEATLELNLEDLYSEDENEFTVQFYRNNQLLFNGFIKPDGVFQSFVNDRWVVNLDCVDGLGILKDLAFVKPNGLQFIGKQSALEIIYNCLIRTNISMDLNTSVNIYYEGLNPLVTLDPLTEIYLSVSRFVKTDKETIMNCQEVLISILTLFKASITQLNGEWYIYRSNELSVNPIVQFRKYSKKNNLFIGVNSRDLRKNLGSQINGKYPHHANSNQQIEIKGSVSAFRVNYKYGFEKGLFLNSDLRYTGNTKQNINYLNFIEGDLTKVFVDSEANSGLRFLIFQSNNDNAVVLTSNNIPLLINETIKFEFALSVIGASAGILRFKIRLANFLMNKEGDWVNIDNDNTMLTTRGESFGSIQSNPLPVSGNLFFEIFSPRNFAQGLSNMTVTKLDIINTTNLNNGAQGEFHTVQRQNRVSSIAKETEEIFNGDSPSIVYEGAIFKADKITPTSKWFRKSKVESKPILQILGEDVLRMSQKPAKVFSGDVYGYIPYLSVVTIDSLEGSFMAIEHSFDSKANITKCKFLQIMHDELTDLNYKLTFDYGNVNKVTIVS